MKLLIQSVMIFFGTLLAAGVVKLGEPAAARLAMQPVPATAAVPALESATDQRIAAAPR